MKIKKQIIYQFGIFFKDYRFILNKICWKRTLFHGNVFLCLNNHSERHSTQNVKSMAFTSILARTRFKGLFNNRHRCKSQICSSVKALRTRFVTCCSSCWKKQVLCHFVSRFIEILSYIDGPVKKNWSVTH